MNKKLKKIVARKSTNEQKITVSANQNGLDIK